MCLDAIEDHRDLEGFAPLHGLTEIDTAIAAGPFMKGIVEHELLRRAAYHELRALYAMRRAGGARYDRSHLAALREFLGLHLESRDDTLQESDPVVDGPSIDEDKPPGRHPPPSSGRPRVTRSTRTTGSRCGHGSSCPGAAGAMAPQVVAI